MTQILDDEIALHRATLAVLLPQRRKIAAEIKRAKRAIRLLNAKAERAKLREARG